MALFRTFPAAALAGVLVSAQASFGLGPGFIWFPAFADGKLAVLGKWIHDFDATNRFESDYGTLTVAWTF